MLFVVAAILEVLARPSLKHVFFGVISVILGLMVAALLADPLSKLPSFWGTYLPLVVSVVFAIAALLLYRKMIPAVDHWIETLIKTFGIGGLTAIFGSHQHRSLASDVIIDTSTLIDGRIVKVAKLGYLPQKVLVPRFIMAELQNIADSKDSDRRNKGKRGLVAVEQLRATKGMFFKVVSDDFPEITEVDHKLVALAKKRSAQLMTTDFNLNKVASTENIRVLNVNELAQQLRPQLLPGDRITVRLIHVGKDKTQGVGYLADGTMIVVENSGSMLEKEVSASVTRSLQTAAGQMYFAKRYGRTNN